MKKAYKRIILIVGVSLIPILFFFFNNYYKQRNISYNFKRNFKYEVKTLKLFDILYNSYYIAGFVDNHIYLGNYQAIFHVLRINASLTDSLFIRIQANRKDLKYNSLYTVRVESDNVYLFNGVDRSILKGTTDNWETFPDPIYTPYFSQAVPINNNTIAFRYVSNKTGFNALRKESKVSGRIENETILEKQVDGLFCTDGVLQYSKMLKKLVYTYYYRNQVILMDTNLQVVKKIKTIDPIDTAIIKVAAVKSNHETTLASPPIMVNARSVIWRKYLFVHSKIMGRHEDHVKFKNSSAIDVYNLETSKYCYSFYLPNHNDHPMAQFIVLEGCILALSDHFLVKYYIDLPD